MHEGWIGTEVGACGKVVKPTSDVSNPQGVKIRINVPPKHFLSCVNPHIVMRNCTLTPIFRTSDVLPRSARHALIEPGQEAGVADNRGVGAGDEGEEGLRWKGVGADCAFAARVWRRGIEMGMLKWKAREMRRGAPRLVAQSRQVRERYLKKMAVLP